MRSIRTMIKIAIGIGLLLIAGYLAFPEARAWMGAAAPFLLILACPLAMYFMMKSMNKPPNEEGKPGEPDRQAEKGIGHK